MCLALLAVMSLIDCVFNLFLRLDEQTKSAWSEVLNQYRRRADLVPNIVATVKGEANFEQKTLTKVVEARAWATFIQVTSETLNNPVSFKKFKDVQGELSGVSYRLMAVIERYPDLNANKGFSDLRVQLEGTENRITPGKHPFYPECARAQRADQQFPQQSDGYALQLPDQTRICGAERSSHHRPHPLLISTRSRRSRVDALAVRAAVGIWRKDSPAE